jgi:membrane-bound inhibitor of C-type lysozyme
MISRKLTRTIAIGAAVVAIGGGAYGIVGATADNGTSTATTAAAAAAPSGRFAAGGGGGSNARSAPSAGGAVGTVAGVSASGFTLTTPAGQKVTVTKSSSTKYLKGTSSISASAVKNGQTVLVLGVTDGTTIAATQVIVQTSASTTASAVVPFQRGAPSTAKQVGQVPSNYTQGSGTIVSGTAANKATQAALAAYPGGVVNRVVKLSNGQYEVHNVGVNWPHHIFVSASYKVLGAN